MISEKLDSEFIVALNQVPPYTVLGQHDIVLYKRKYVDYWPLNWFYYDICKNPKTKEYFEKASNQNTNCMSQ